MNHYPRHIGDFNNATRHLTRLERSIYSDLLDLYYETERALMADVGRLARRIIATTPDEREALDAVLSEFFVLEDDGFHNKRCDEEIAAYQAARRGWQETTGKGAAGREKPTRLFWKPTRLFLGFQKNRRES